MLPTGGGKIFGPKKFSGVGENFFANLGVGDGLFEPKGGVKRILLKGELKIFQQRGAKLPLGHTLNWGVQMKKISFGGGKKNFSYGILNTCPRMPKAEKLLRISHCVKTTVLLWVQHQGKLEFFNSERRHKMWKICEVIVLKIQALLLRHIKCNFPKDRSLLTMHSVQNLNIFKVIISSNKWQKIQFSLHISAASGTRKPENPNFENETRQTRTFVK